VILKDPDDPFSGVTAMNEWWGKLEANVSSRHVRLEHTQRFIIQALN
jgi:hypothetical protein